MAAIALCGGVKESNAPSGLQQPIARQVPPVGLGAPCGRQAEGPSASTSLPYQPGTSTGKVVELSCGPQYFPSPFSQFLLVVLSLWL